MQSTFGPLACTRTGRLRPLMAQLAWLQTQKKGHRHFHCETPNPKPQSGRRHRDCQPKADGARCTLLALQERDRKDRRRNQGVIPSIRRSSMRHRKRNNHNAKTGIGTGMDNQPAADGTNASTLQPHTLQPHTLQTHTQSLTLTHSHSVTT